MLIREDRLPLPVRWPLYTGQAARPVLVLVLMLLLTLALAGCATTPGQSGPLLGDEKVAALAAAGDWATLAAGRIACKAQTEDCAKAHATQGDACLRLAIELPQGADQQNQRLRRLLDCAEAAYRQALAYQPDPNAASRVSFHGGLLLTLSERRNRLDNLERGDRLGMENERLLLAAQAARREASGNALGFVYGASAHAYRALLKPTGRARCNDLRQAQAMLNRSPPPPRELSDERARISSLIARELRSNACPRVQRR